jgi:hypothetical protein
MKTIRFLLGTFLILLLTYCESKDSDFKSTGVIVGRDYTLCSCCGGWIIHIDDTTYLFDSIPDNSNINLETEILPITVKLDWQLVPGICPSRITIQRIKKIY